MREAAEFVMYKGTKITPGWPVKVLPSKPGKQDGFETLIRVIWVNPETKRISDFEVVDPETRGIRNFFPARIQPYLRNVEKKREEMLAKEAKLRGRLLDDLQKTRPRAGDARPTRAAARK